MPPDEQVEFEIGLRDSISSGLRQIGREIDIVTKKLREGGETGTKSFEAINKGFEKTKGEADKTKNSMSGLHSFMSGMSRTLMGTTGLAAGLLAIGDALTSFAQKRVHMQALAIDLGLSNEQMSIMRRTLSRLGVDAGAQGQLITQLGSSLKEAFRMGPRSELVQQLNEMGQTGFAGRLLAIVKSGDFNEAMNTIVDQYNKILNLVGPEAAAHFAKIVGWPESVLRQWKEASAGVKAGYIAQYADSEEYLKKSMEFSEKFEDISKAIKSTAIDMFLAVDRELRKYDWIFLGGLPVPITPQKPKDMTPKQMGTFGLEDEGALPPNKTLNSYVMQGMAEEDRKTNRLLGEISSTLSTFERTLTGGSGSSGGSRGGGGSPGGSFSTGRGGFGASSWQGSAGLGRFAVPARALTGSGSMFSRSQHAPIQTEQPTSGGLSSARSKFAEELKDPAVRDRLMAYTYAEVGGEGPKAAQAFMETIFNRASARGQSLKQTLGGAYFPAITHRRVGRGVTPGQRELYGPMIDQVLGGSNISGFATGNASGSVGFAGGPQTSAFGRERFGIEGPDRNWARKMREDAESVSGGNANVRELQGQIAGIRRGALSRQTRGFLDYASSRTGLGVEVGSGGQPASGPGRTGSHRHDFGGAADLKLFEEVDGKKRYLDMRIPGDRVRMEEFTAHAVSAGATGVGAGLGYMGPNTIHIGGGKRATWGGADWIERAAQRGLVDQSLQRKVSSQNAKGSVKAEVDFSNLPAGAKKSGDELGKFKILKIQANPQGAKDLEQVLTPGDLSHTPYVP